MIGDDDLNGDSSLDDGLTALEIKSARDRILFDLPGRRHMFERWLISKSVDDMLQGQLAAVKPYSKSSLPRSVTAHYRATLSSSQTTYEWNWRHHFKPLHLVGSTALMFSLAGLYLAIRFGVEFQAIVPLIAIATYWTYRKVK